MFSYSMAVKLTTDFQDVDDEGLLSALPPPLTVLPLPSPNSLVIVSDPEGNSCWARVVKTDMPLIYVAPIWETWHDGRPVQITSSAGPEVTPEPACTTTVGALAGT
jgi:hypothetical protein